MTINNAVLKNCLKLSSKITVYVPATNGIDQAADNTEQVKKTAALLSELFGGATSTPALGYWMSPAAGPGGRGYNGSFRLRCGCGAPGARRARGGAVRGAEAGDGTRGHRPGNQRRDVFHLTAGRRARATAPARFSVFRGHARKFFGTVSRSGAVSVIITEGHKKLYGGDEHGK